MEIHGEQEKPGLYTQRTQANKGHKEKMDDWPERKEIKGRGRKGRKVCV